MSDLTPIDLGDGDYRLPDLVHRVEATGEGYLVLEHGRPVARLRPAEEPRPAGRITPEQEAALKRFLSTSWDLGIGKFDRDEIYDERADELIRRGQR